MSRADDNSDLSSPLLEDSSISMNNNVIGGGAGGVTLHGESVDLRHMFPSTSPGENNTEESSSHHIGTVVLNPEEEQRGDAGEQQPGRDTLSLDQQSTATGSKNKNGVASGARSKLAHAKQALVFLPKRGLAAFYRTRHALSNLMGGAKISDQGGLTPVANANVNAEFSDDTTPLHRSNNAQNPFSSRSGGNDPIQRKNDRITQSTSLFSSSTTNCLLRYIVPLLLVTNHVVFFHAQTRPMWNLTAKSDVSITATATTLKSKAAADALNVPHHYEFVSNETKVVETFTYMDAIRKLWKGEGLGDAKALSKVAAALLVLASGIWPHLKLLCMMACWFVPFASGLWLGNSVDDADCNDDEGDVGGMTRRCRRRKRGCRGSCAGGNGCRTSCRGLVCSSGHRKHVTTNSRTPFLRTLGTLGKWSLADILVVCILIAVLHLDWTVQPDEIRSGIEDQLPTLLEYAQSKYPDEVVDCSHLLGYTCGRHALVIHYPTCLTCQSLIKNAYHHPEWTAGEGRAILDGVKLEGGGYAQLRVMGMKGTYLFCGAVLLSILLSLVVELVDERDRDAVEDELVDRRRELEFILVPPGEDGGGDGELGLSVEEESPLHHQQPVEPPLNEAFSLDREEVMISDNNSNQEQTPRSSLSTYKKQYDHNHHTVIPAPTTNCYLLKQALLTLLSLMSLPLVCYAVSLPTMQRLVFGGGPTLLHKVLGMIWETEYSLVTLVKTTGDAGGWDNFLMITFGMFAVVGPILRSACLILHVLLGLPVALLGDCIERQRLRRRNATTLRRVLFQASYTFRRALLPVIDALGAFGCWEVLMVALLMIQLEMPAITDTIYQDDRCREVDPEHGRTCIEMQFNATDNFLLVGIAWIVLVVACGLAMDAASDENSLDNIVRLANKEEKRYEFGQPIPQRRSNLNREQTWMQGTSSSKPTNQQQQQNRLGDNENNDEYYSPVQRGTSGRNNGLEEIVFV